MKQSTTNCTKCNVTCHDNSPIISDGLKGKCLAITDGYCNVCLGKCHWSEHRNQPFIYTMKMESKKMTTKELKTKYQTSHDEQLISKNLVAILTTKIKTIWDKIIGLAERATKSFEKLDQIALRPSPL